MNATVDIKAIQWVEGGPSGTQSSASAWSAFDLLCRWFEDFGWSASAPFGTADYDASADLGNGRFAFRIDKAVVIADVEYDADVSGDRYVDRSKCVRVEVSRG